MTSNNTAILEYNPIIESKWQIVNKVIDYLDEKNDSTESTNGLTIDDYIYAETNDVDSIQIKTETKNDPINENLQLQIYNISIPKRWKIEGVLPPTIECKKKAANIVSLFYQKYKLYPLRTSATIEEGVFLKYKDYSTKKELSIEVYNDLDIAAIITREKNILKSVDIIDEDFSKIISIYQAR